MKLRGFHTETALARLATAMLVAFCIGCKKNSNVGEVSGRVTYGGKPLSTAQVDFDPEGEGKKSVGYTDANGYYELQYTLHETGALVGRHKVRVIVMPAEGSPPLSIPAEYGSNSQLEFEVQPGHNRFDIDIPDS
jgi:hypothetical protein